MFMFVVCVCVVHMHTCIGNYTLVIRRQYGCPCLSISWFSFQMWTAFYWSCKFMPGANIQIVN